VFALDSHLTIQDTEFNSLRIICGCGESFGAALAVIGGSANVLVLKCDFINNLSATCGARGGAVALGMPGNNRGNLRIQGSRFLNNYSDGDGGAIAMQSTDRLEIDGANGVPCVFENNSAGRHGGAISINVDWVDIGTFLLDDASFVNNASGSQGGAIALYLRYGAFSLSDLKFTTNASGSQGGAIYVRQDLAGTITRSMSKCVFVNNASANGGGLYLNGTQSPIRLSQTVYCGNDPSDIQGSYIDNGGNCFTTSCSDADNSGYPDTCEIPIIDCNGNDIPDDEELLDNDVNNDGVPDDCQAGNDFAGLETEIRPITHVVNGLPQTAVTWRVYAKFRKGASLATVTALFGNAQWPLLVSNAAGFYQSATGGNTVEDIICNSPDTSLLYDSFFTISAECRSQTDLQFTPGLSFTSFNEATNASLSTSNGAIFVAPGTEASRAGDDLRVLLMQLTTKTAARPTATINLTGDNAAQVPDNEWYAYALPIPEAAVTSAVDCDGNGTHDALDIAGGARDCNLDGIPDSCQSPDLAADCDGDGTPDACEIRFGLATDTNLDGIPDNCQCQGDVDQNGAVNVDDLLEIFAAWGDPNPGAADLNGDGVCNGQDLVLVLSGWGACL
jgi:predicted outer membrane repeat protein